MNPVIEDRLPKLEEIELQRGGHNSMEDGVCAMEMVAFLAGEEHSDTPACTSPILGAFLRAWNDAIDDEGRQKLKPYLPKVIGTADDGQDEVRGWLCADWLVRVCTPTWLEMAGITDSATALRELPALTDQASLERARPVLDRARSKSAAAWAAARAAAWAAARDAAWDAARAAAWDAAWAAARAAAWDAAWAAAWAAAWDAAWAAAWAAARAAADKGGSYQQQYDAAKKAADEKLAPTRDGLQASALQLLDVLVDPKAAA